MASVQSFRPLSAGEAEDLRPGRISLHVVRDGDSWSALAERSGGQVRGATLARMNNVSPDSQPRAGATIKIVVGR
jgi:predicted Zn-dependent protease